MIASTVDEVRGASPTGVMGSGFKERSFAAALAAKPHFIGCDGGSTDPGPYPLGACTTAFPRVSIKRDLRLMLKGARGLRVPLLLGSVGTAEGDVHLAGIQSIIEEIAAEERLRFRLGVVRSEQDKPYLKEKLRQGRIKPLHPAPRFDEAVIGRSTRIVGMMGDDPYLEALDAGADVVLAERSSDTAIFAGLPVRHGLPAGLAWHAAQILECGA
ncbi:MAG: acyclic terpene utilization AtuA family protein, partial [Candidatus Brocadiia bacterium]|nr:acyclic terpene utilization AtuA family protein [Candidatus Brocadiia bacterium]